MQSARSCIVILLRHGLAQKNLTQGTPGKDAAMEACRSELLCGGKAPQLRVCQLSALHSVSASAFACHQHTSYV